MSKNHGSQVGSTLNRSLSDAVVLEMVPDVLVRIQLRCIRGQEEELHASLSGSDEVAYFVRAVRRVAIDDQEDRSFGSVKKTLQEHDELVRVHSPVHDHEPEVSPRADGGYHVHAEALPGRGDDLSVLRIDPKCQIDSGVRSYAASFHTYRW